MIARRGIQAVLWPLLLLACLTSCEEKEYDLGKLFRSTPLSERFEGLKPKNPPSVRRKHAYWLMNNTDKLSENQRKIIVPLLTELLLKDEDRLIRGYAAATLGRLHDPDAIPSLIEGLKDKETLVRCDVVKAISRYRQESLLPEIVKVSQTDRDADVRQTAILAIADLGGRGAIPPLVDALSDRETNVVFTASQCLAEITGQKLGLSQEAWRAWWRDNADKPLPSEKAGKAKKKKKSDKAFLIF